MPRYDYKNDKTGEVKEIIQTMSEKHCYIDKKGFKWRRIFTVPEMAIDSSFVNVDPNDMKSFVQKTSKGGTFGDVVDYSQELHEKRGGAGNDEVKEAYYKDYAAKRNGSKHNDVKVREVKAKLDKIGISITPD